MARASRRSISKAAIRANKEKVASYIGAGLVGGSLQPLLQFLLNAIPEDAAVGTKIGTLSLLNITGTWSFSKVADPDGKFAVNATTGAVTLAVALDYETKTAHSVTFEATNGLLTLRETFIVVVSNVIEGTLGPTTASFLQGSATTTSIATVTGLDAGASETLSSISPNDGRLSILGGNRIVVGSTVSKDGVINATVTTSVGRTLSIAITVEVPALVLFSPTTNMLAAMGATQADWDAIAAKGLKEINPAAVPYVGRAQDPGRIDNGRGDGNYVSSRALAKDFNAVVYENQWKPTYEITEGTLTTSGIASIDADLAAKAPAMLANKVLHLGAGWNTYHPSWAVTKITNDPVYMKTYLDNRLAQIAAYFMDPANAGEREKYYRVDPVNEQSNQPANGVTADNDGWRIVNNFLRVASKTAAGLEAYGAGNTDSEKWIQRLFTQFKAIFPNADLCWTDFNLEQVQVAEDLTTARYSYDPAGPTSLYSVASDGSGAQNRFRLERVKYEIFRYLKAGVPINGVGYQMHTSSYYAFAEIDYRASLWDWNRWGIRPGMTEINADTNAPGHLGSSPSVDVVNRYNAVHCARPVEIMLEETTCREVMTWTVRNAAGTADIQPTVDKDKEYPLRAAIALVLKRAKPVAERTLKRGSHITFRTRASMNVEVKGSQSFSGNRIAQTAAGYIRRAWDWYNDTWMAKPIAPETMILRAQFCVNSNAFPAAGAVIIGEFSADGTYGIALVGKLVSGSNKLFVRQRVGGVNNDYEVPGAVLSLTNALRQCAYMAFSAERSLVKVGYGQLAIAIDATTGAQTVTPSSIVEQTIAMSASQPVKANGHVYVASDPQETVYHSSLQINIMAVYHGPDYPTDEARQALAIPHRQGAWVPKIGSAFYAGD